MLYAVSIVCTLFTVSPAVICKLSSWPIFVALAYWRLCAVSCARLHGFSDGEQQTFKIVKLNSQKQQQKIPLSAHCRLHVRNFFCVHAFEPQIVRLADSQMFARRDGGFAQFLVHVCTVSQAVSSKLSN